MTVRDFRRTTVGVGSQITRIAVLDSVAGRENVLPKGRSYADEEDGRTVAVRWILPWRASRLSLRELF